MGKHLTKDFANFKKRVDTALRQLPVLVANEAKNFFLDSFRVQAWQGETTQLWKKRKNDGKKGNGASVLVKKGTLKRAILVKTGTLKRAIRVKQADWNKVVIVNDTPYAGIHNEGFRGTEQVGEHSRIASRRVATNYSNRTGKGLKKGQVKIQGKSHQVVAHSRRMNMPKRRFMGNSPYLNTRIQRLITARLMKTK
jgi:phage gpG-like protein